MEQYENERRIQNVLLNDTSQELVEGEVILPVGKPEMARILTVLPRVEAYGWEVDSGRLTVEGSLTLLVCYLCSDGLPHSFESTSSYRHTKEIPGAMPGMRTTPVVLPSHVEYVLEDGRSLRVKATIDFGTPVEDEMPLTALPFDEVEADTSAQPLELQFSKTVARMSLTGEIEGNVPVPGGIAPMDRILSCTGYPGIKRTVFDGETLSIEGEVKLNIVYATGEETAPIAQLYTSLDFDEMVAADDMDGEILVTAQVKKIYALLDEMGDSIAISAQYGMEISCKRKFSFTGIKDAYSALYDTQLETQGLTLTEKALHKEGNNALRERMEFDDAPAPARILASVILPSFCRAYESGGILAIEGVMSCQVAYISFDGVIQTAIGKIPIRMEEPGIEVDPGMELFAQVGAEQVQAVPAGNEVEVRALLQYQLEGYHRHEVTLVQDIVALSEEIVRESGILIYFAQRGDTLWNVAKHYRMDVEAIRAQNPGVEDALVPGQRLVLVCRPN
ncbi:DUF3794 domain-containing protein [Eubacteriales bacterium OttesenSCG-928-M02]|nr:DUF3794 domain-containing protein [Eubacteriales bacterium OttesenSCG-928-M02]